MPQQHGLIHVYSNQQAITSENDDAGISYVYRGSRVIEPRFADLLSMDFRLEPEAMSVLADAYPRGNAPGVMLGAT
jgi:hypothetical protein